MSNTRTEDDEITTLRSERDQLLRTLEAGRTAIDTVMDANAQSAPKATLAILLGRANEALTVTGGST